MKAYMVWETDPSEHAELVFATSARQARQQAWKHPYGEEFFAYIQLRVRRVSECDQLYGGQEPWTCDDDHILRQAGWFFGDPEE